jgi:integrase
MRTVLKNNPNTIVTNLKGIRHIVAESVKENIMSAKRNPFLYYKLEWKQTERVFLTEEEIKAIEDLSLPEDSIKFHVRNIYIFACYAGGIRIADILSLKWENFSDDHILLSTHKTGSVISVKLPNKALSILEIYQKEGLKKDDYIFPFINKLSNDLNPSDFYSYTLSITGNINLKLKSIAKMAGIEKHIHFHTSRHTWATRALRKGMRIEYVSKLMGHNSIRTTQIYAKIINADLDKAMEVFDD